MDKLNIFHLNLRKSSHPSRFICNSLVNFKTVILSVNEPDCNSRTGKNLVISSFNINYLPFVLAYIVFIIFSFF